MMMIVDCVCYDECETSRKMIFFSGSSSSTNNKTYTRDMIWNEMKWKKNQEEENEEKKLLTQSHRHLKGSRIRHREMMMKKKQHEERERDWKQRNGNLSFFCLKPLINKKKTIHWIKWEKEEEEERNKI